MAVLDSELTAKGETTRRAILDAAIERFGRDGYRSTSVAAIARDAEVSGTATYAYFADKEALFFAAVDEDAAGVIAEGVTSLLDEPEFRNLQQTLMVSLLGAIDRHPLARRLLAGLEPEVTERVLTIPALEDLRELLAERIRAGQRDGLVRAGIDPASIASGIVAIVLSLLMSVTQIGPGAAAAYGLDVVSVLEAALHDD